jgi:Na+-transporting methylmalonyl-CoA/oxaloacetate decarboxylase gamma subunit
MKPEIYLLTISLPLLTAIIVFAMKYASSYAASRARLAEERELNKSVEIQASELAQIKELLHIIAAKIADQSRTISSVETILKQVG